MFEQYCHRYFYLILYLIPALPPLRSRRTPCLCLLLRKGVAFSLSGRVAFSLSGRVAFSLSGRVAFSLLGRVAFSLLRTSYRAPSPFQGEKPKDKKPKAGQRLTESFGFIRQGIHKGGKDPNKGELIGKELGKWKLEHKRGVKISKTVILKFI